MESNALEKPLFSSGRESRIAVRDETEEEYLSDEDRFISVPPSITTKAMTSDTSQPVMNDSSVDSPKYLVDDNSKQKDKENNNETHTFIDKSSTKLPEDSLSNNIHQRIVDKGFEPDMEANNENIAEQRRTENDTGETLKISRTIIQSNTTEHSDKCELSNLTENEVNRDSGSHETGDDLETSNLNENEVDSDRARCRPLGNQDELLQSDKECEVGTKNVIDSVSSSTETIDTCKNTATSLQNEKDKEENGDQLPSSGEEEKNSKLNESENDSKNITSESEEQSCFRKADSRSQTSTEHWTELEVDEDVIDKIIIHTPGRNEPTINLEVISQLSQREKSIDKECSDNQQLSMNSTNFSDAEGQQTENDHTDSSNGDRNSSDEPSDTNHLKSTREPKRTKKRVRKYINDEIQTEDSSENESCIQQNKEVIKGTEANAKNHSIHDDVGNDKNTRTTCEKISIKSNNEDSNGESENSDNIETEVDSSEEDSDSIQSLSDSDTSNPSDSDNSCNKSHIRHKLQVQMLQKSDSGYSEKKVISSASTKGKTTVNKDTKSSKQPTYDLKSVSSFQHVRSLSSAVSETTLSRQKTRMSNGKPSSQRSDLKKIKSEKVASTQYDKRTKQNRLEYIERMKKIYKQKVTLKDNNAKEKNVNSSNSLPNISSPQKSPSYSIKEIKVYDTQTDNRNSNKPVYVSYSSYNRKDKKANSVNDHTASKRPKEDILLDKRKSSSRQTTATENAVKVSYQRLNLGDNTTNSCNTPKAAQKDENQTFHQVAQKAITNQRCHKHGNRHQSKETVVKDINSLHNEFHALCVKSLSQQKKDVDTSAKNTVDRRLEITMNEMIALHGSSLDTNDGDFVLNKPDLTQQSGQPTLNDPPPHVTQALIVDMPIQKVPNHIQSRKSEIDTFSFESPSKHTVEHNDKKSVNSRAKEEFESNDGRRKKDLKDQDEEEKREKFPSDEPDKVLQEKRSRLKASKTYENIYKYELSESHVTVSKGKESEDIPVDGIIEVTDKTAVSDKDIEEKIVLPDEAKDNVHLSTEQRKSDSRSNIFCAFFI